MSVAMDKLWDASMEENGFEVFMKEFYSPSYNGGEEYAELIHTLPKVDNIIALYPRQIGKTATLCGFALWKALRTKSNILYVVHNNIMRSFIVARVDIDAAKNNIISCNKNNITFVNGSHISITTDASFEYASRGNNFSHILLDEASGYQNSVQGNIVDYINIFNARVYILTTSNWNTPINNLWIDSAKGNTKYVAIGSM
jgi:hypothetical protein